MMRSDDDNAVILLSYHYMSDYIGVLWRLGLRRRLKVEGKFRDARISGFMLGELPDPCTITPTLYSYSFGGQSVVKVDGEIKFIEE